MSDRAMGIAQQAGLPQAPEHERAVLATCMETSSAMEAAVALLESGDFYHTGRRFLWDTLTSLHREGAATDRTSAFQHLIDKGHLPRIGSMMSDYLEPLPSGAGILEQYCGVLRNQAIRRALLEQAAKLQQLALHGGDTEDLQAVVLEATEVIGRTAGKSDDMRSFAEIYGTFENWQDFTGRKAKPEIPLPFVCCLSGLRVGEYTILAARPGDGKSALAMNIATFAAKNGHVVFFFSFEMRDQALLRRAVAGHASVSHYRLANGKLRNEEDARAFKQMPEIFDLPVYVNDAHSGTGVEQIKRVLRRAQAKGQCPSLVVIDYLQLMRTSGGHNRNEEISRISRALKVLTLEFPIALLALSQLSRDQEKQGKREPILSDLRDSGSLEQDADNVVFIHPIGEVDVPERLVRLITRKQRSGGTGATELRFIRDQLRFESLDQQERL